LLVGIDSQETELKHGLGIPHVTECAQHMLAGEGEIFAT